MLEVSLAEKLIEQIRRILTGRLVPGKQDPPQ